MSVTVAKRDIAESNIIVVPHPELSLPWKVGSVPRSDFEIFLAVAMNRTSVIGLYSASVRAGRAWALPIFWPFINYSLSIIVFVHNHV